MFEDYDEVDDSVSNSSSSVPSLAEDQHEEDPEQDLEAELNTEIDRLFVTVQDLDRTDTRKRLATANTLISPQPASRDIFHTAKR